SGQVLLRIPKRLQILQSLRRNNRPFPIRLCHSSEFIYFNWGTSSTTLRFLRAKRDHFLAFYTGRDENFINATITKVHQILYAKRSSNEYDISGVLNMAKIHLHVL
ncbi:Uncharacterized protein FKW44_009577, partial [Caligus rogercresseyi]